MKLGEAELHRRRDALVEAEYPNIREDVARLITWCAEYRRERFGEIWDPRTYSIAWTQGFLAAAKRPDLAKRWMEAHDYAARLIPDDATD